jgi:hypothetical protein
MSADIIVPEGGLLPLTPLGTGQPVGICEGDVCEIPAPETVEDAAVSDADEKEPDDKPE